MEQQKEDGQTDYWLVQYQRLMDRKPQALMDQVCCLSQRQLPILFIYMIDFFLNKDL